MFPILLPIIVAFLIVLLFSQFGILDIIAFHDDVVGVATAGRTGGTEIDETYIKNDDGKIDEDSQGRLPVLHDVIHAEFDVLTDEIVHKGWWELQPNKWPNIRRLSGWNDWNASEITESGAGTLHPGVPLVYRSYPRFNIPLTKNLDWISGQSKIASGLTNADICLLFCYSYGPQYPYTPGNRLHRIMKVADAAMGAADTFDESWSAQLTGVTPGLDETKDYIIRGVINEPAVKDKLNALCRIGTQKGEYKIIGLGSGNFLQPVETLFMWDGIPIHGLTGITCEHLGGVTDTPWGGLVLEEIGESYVVPGSRPRAPPRAPPPLAAAPAFPVPPRTAAPGPPRGLAVPGPGGGIANIIGGGLKAMFGGGRF